jgi:hypothetical protein
LVRVLYSTRRLSTSDQATARAPFIRLEVTKSGKRREAPLNAESYAALVSLGPKESGRVFRRQNLRKAYENAVNNAKLDNVNFHTRSRPGRSCAASA